MHRCRRCFYWPEAGPVEVTLYSYVCWRANFQHRRSAASCCPALILQACRPPAAVPPPPAAAAMVESAAVNALEKASSVRDWFFLTHEQFFQCFCYLFQSFTRKYFFHQFQFYVFHEQSETTSCAMLPDTLIQILVLTVFLLP